MSRDYAFPFAVALALHAGLLFALKPRLPWTPPPAALLEIELPAAEPAAGPATAAASPSPPEAPAPTPPPAPEPPPEPAPTEAPLPRPTAEAAEPAATPRPRPARPPPHPAASIRPGKPASRPIVTRPNGTGTGAGGGAGSLNSGVRYLYNPPPDYPPEARARREEGVVIIGAEISASGRVIDAGVSHGSGFAVLDQAALRAVRHWIFTPARQGGLDIPAHADIPVRFYLSQ